MRWPRVQRVKRFKLLYEKNHDTYNIEPESQGSKGIRLVESFVDYSAGRDARSRKGEGMGVARLLLSTCARSQWEATMARGSWDESNKSGEVISRLETHRGKRSDATFRWFISVIQLSSSSASIPPFNSRPAINNLPAIVPTLPYFCLFLPSLETRDSQSSFGWKHGLPIECRALLSGEFGKRPSRKSKRNASVRVGNVLLEAITRAGTT